jgi:ribosomal protein S18 acetylase RimI-like enzyme
MQKEHVIAVARLHIDGIDKGFISSLGEDFVKYLYESIVWLPQSFGFVAVEKGRIVGFVSCVEDLRIVYKYVLKHHVFSLFWKMLPKLLKWRNIKNVFETLFYPSKQDNNLPVAEMLSLVVSKEFRGKGIGRKLLEQALLEYLKRGFVVVKVMAGEELKANKLYERIGFQLVGQYTHHGHLTNFYVVCCQEVLSKLRQTFLV